MNIALHKSGLRFETAPGPFFGPKQKAIVELKKYIGTPFSEVEFLDFLELNYSKYFKAIEWVRFYDFKDNSYPKMKYDGQMKLALMNVKANIEARQSLFEVRSEITKLTGWYPLIMGSRANFTTKPLKRLWNTDSIESIGKLIGFKPIANSDKDGISFELTGTNGKYLFDFGYNGVGNDNYKAFFLTHTHSDHSQGFENSILNNSDKYILTICSKPVCSFLHYRMSLNKSLTKYRNCVHINFTGEFKFNDGLSIGFFPVFHSPGSLGIRVTDTNGISFFYLGDFCLKNGYSTFNDSLLQILDKQKTKKNYLLLDAAMVGRKQFIEEQDTPESILSEFSKNVTRRNIVFFSNQPENSIYAYLKVFHQTQQDENLKSIKLFVSTSLLQSLNLIIEPVIFQKKEFKDPVFTTLFGKTTSNPIESQRLYPLTEELLNSLKEEERIIIFAGINDLNRIPSLKKRFEKSDIILAGTFALREELPPELVKAKPRTIIRVASEDWSFHSNQQDLIKFIQDIASPTFKVYLFHNYYPRLLKVVQEYKMDSRFVRVLGDKYKFENF